MATGTVKKIETAYTNQYRVESFGTSTSITPSHNGWMVVTAQVTSSQTVQPILRIEHGNSILAESIGLTINTTNLHAACPVIAGVTYTTVFYRCEQTQADVFY